MMGLTRGIRLEEPHIVLTNLDLEDEYPNPKVASQLILNLEERLRLQTPNEDVDFIESRGIIHTCRFYPDKLLNEEFMQALVARDPRRFEPRPLNEYENARLKVGDYGLIDSLYLAEAGIKDELGPEFVEIGVRSWGLTTKVCDS